MTTLSADKREEIIKWVEEYDIPIVPLLPGTKKTGDDWRDVDFSKVDFRAKLENGDYDNGILIRLGETLTGKNGKYLIAIDLDGQWAVDQWFRDWEAVQTYSKDQLVEWHDDQFKLHVLFYVDEKMKNVKILNKNGSGQVEIRCENLLLAVSPSKHISGNYYAPLGTKAIPRLDRKDLLRLEAKIDILSNKYMSNEHKDEYNQWLEEPDVTLGEGDGRHDATLFKACSYYFKYSGDWLWLSDEERFERCWDWHISHCKPPRTREHCDEIFEWIVEHKKDERDEFLKPIKEEWNRKKKQQEDFTKNGGHSDSKKEVLNGLLWRTNETVAKELDSNIWTLVSETPIKFIIARHKSRDICKAQVDFVDVGQSQKVAHLHYGTILIRLLPKRVILHENPLKFLDAPITYTIVFENNMKRQVQFSGSIETIVSKIKEHPGYVVGSQGITEALTAIIGAFDDDLHLEIDNSVDFEGFFTYEGQIYCSQIDFNEKHPSRTNEEVLDCIEYLEKRSEFQVWDYNDRTIDRRDLLATCIKWTIPAPYNFVKKQLNHKPYLKGFDMEGERDGGKSGLSEEMLNMHGNPTNSQDANTIYSMSAGSVNTEAKFGKALSRTTYPVEISEFGRIEQYGRYENLVEPFKTSVDSLITRRGKKDNKYDAPFPSLSPIIVNGNPKFTFKGEILKRFWNTKFSAEDRHSNDQNSPFNKFQRENSYKLKILGDWTMRYIWENRNELLLSKEYDIQKVGEKALEEFYKSVGKEVPAWLKLWIKDTALEELDIDDKDVIINTILDNITHSLRENSQFIKIDNQGNITREQRIGLALEHETLTWVTKAKNQKDEYHIDTGVLELFKNKLPDLTPIKIAETLGLEHKHLKIGNRIVFNEKQFKDILLRKSTE